MAKRRGEHEAAAEIWETLARDADWQVRSCGELAWHFERRRKDFRTALKYAKQAMAALRKRTSADPFARPGTGDLRTFEQLKKKIERLELRTKKASTEPLLQEAQ